MTFTKDAELDTNPEIVKPKRKFELFELIIHVQL